MPDKIEIDYADIELQEVENRFLEDIRNNPNNFSFWFPKVHKCGIPVPESKVIQLSDKIIRSLFLEREGDDDRITEFVRKKVLPAIPENWTRVFVKNGTYSGKFDFRNCCIRPTLHSLVTSIEAINQDALCLDADGESELVIREYLPVTRHEGEEDDVKVYRIYNGMPLRPEIRVFYDFDHGKALYAANYWDKDYCHDAICSGDCTDALAYEAAWPTLKRFFEQNTRKAMDLLDKHLGKVKLKGIWSVDLMWHDGQFWLIDMAVGQRSAYYDPEKVRKALSGEDVTDEPTLMTPATRNNRITAYTDGGYHLHKDEGAYAFVILQNDNIIHKQATVIRHESNNRGELKAILDAVDWCPDGAEIEVHSDSQYAIFTLSGEWARRKNTDLFDRWEEILARKRCKVTFRWVKGHSGDRYNEMCDRMCDEAVGYDLNSWIPKKK